MPPLPGLGTSKQTSLIVGEDPEAVGGSAKLSESSSNTSMESQGLAASQTFGGRTLQRHLSESKKENYE